METQRTSVRYSGRGNLHAAFNVSFIAMTIFGLSLLFVGIYQLNFKYNFMEYDLLSFVWSNTIFTILLMLYSFFAIRSKMVTEGILYLLAAMSSLLLTVYLYYPDSDSVRFLMILFLGGFFGCGIIFMQRKERTLVVTSFVMALYCIFVNVLPLDWLYILGGVISVLGVALVVVGCAAIAGIESGLVNLIPPPITKTSDEDYPRVFEDTVGAILLVIITFLYLYAVFYNYKVPEAYYVFTMVASLITLAAALYGIYHGVFGQTVLMLLLAISKLIFTFFYYLGLGTTTHIDLLFVVIFVPLMISFYVKGDKLIALLTLATAITTVAQTFTGYFFIVELFMAIANIIAIYFAVDMWYYSECGVRLKDTEFVRKLIGKVTHDKG